VLRRVSQRSPHGTEAGVALVEFALVLPLLMLLLLGMLDVGKALNYWIDETHLAHTGARWAVVDRHPGTGSLQQYVQDQADTAELRSRASVCVDFPRNPTTGTSGKVGDPVKVTVGVPYQWLAFVSDTLGIDTLITIRATSTMRLEARPTTYSEGCSSPPASP
jgi:Flp pilus assembly protein TadG